MLHVQSERGGGEGGEKKVQPLSPWQEGYGEVLVKAAFEAELCVLRSIFKVCRLCSMGIQHTVRSKVSFWRRELQIRPALSGEKTVVNQQKGTWT